MRLTTCDSVIYATLCLAGEGQSEGRQSRNAQLGALQRIGAGHRVGASRRWALVVAAPWLSVDVAVARLTPSRAPTPGPRPPYPRPKGGA